MTWFPIGPDFIYTPRDTTAPQRISRRNMYARQTQIWGIAVDPNDSNAIYTIDQNSYAGAMPKGGVVAFATGDGGRSWTPISDSLQQNDYTLQPASVAVHPVNGSYVYMGTTGGAFYVSSNKGGVWNAPVTIGSGGGISQIIVDPRNAANPATTVIYAGTANGVYVSTNGGATWGATPVLAGVVSSMAFSLPSTGADCYVGIFQQGIYYSASPATTAWAQVTGNGLPAVGTFDHVWVQYCPANPQRAYCYFESVSTGSVAICTTGKGSTNWSKVNTSTMPTSSGLFAVAPNSPGNGQKDILFLGHLYLSRSTDSGQTWVGGGDAYHVDQRSFAFAPPNPPSGTIPMMLVGNDGGLIGSTGFADPAYNYGAAPTDFDDRATYTNSGVAQNLNQGKMSAALHAYNSDPAASAIGYIVCDDTGLAGHSSALGWRGLGNGDGDRVACTPGANGMKVWASIGFPYATYIITDTGVPGDVPWTACLFNGNSFASSSNHVLSLGKTCITGTMNSNGSVAGPIVNVDQMGTATQISQTFPNFAQVVAASPVDATFLACVTRDEYTFQNSHLFVTQGVALGPTTVWNEATTSKPAGIIASVAIDHGGTVYALMQTAVGGTPLFAISGGAWTAVASTGLPGLPYGRLVADPQTAGVLYAVSGGQVYRISVNGGSAAWGNVGSGLPGTHVDDLWVGLIPGGKVLLRAVAAARGVWECDVTGGTMDPPTRPYVRDNLLDQGWFAPSPDGLVNPYRPADGISVYHYLSADVKVDAQQPGSPAFFQTDPEGTSALSHVLFDVMNDNSENLPGSDAAMVHVQVHNRSYTPVSPNVWAIYASAAAGVPSLSASAMNGNNFNFWGQFQAGGAIVPNLPSDSPWTSIGNPVPLSGIDAARPGVASWQWTVPLLATGDPGHYCMAVFLHSAANPIGEATNYSVDSLAHTNPQVGQKNLHIGAPLPPSPIPPPPPPLPGFRRMREYIEFHNATTERRVADLVFDLRPLPPELQLWLRLSELKTQAPLEQSLEGIATTHHPGLADDLKSALLAGVHEVDELLEWFERCLHRLEDELGDGGGGTHHEHRSHHKPHKGLRFTAPIYRAKTASLVAVRGVELPPHGAAAALMTIENHGELPKGSEYRFQVQQVLGGRVVGGSTYVIRIAGHAAHRRTGSEIALDHY